MHRVPVLLLLYTVHSFNLECCYVVHARVCWYVTHACLEAFYVARVSLCWPRLSCILRLFDFCAMLRMLQLKHYMELSLVITLHQLCLTEQLACIKLPYWSNQRQGLQSRELHCREPCGYTHGISTRLVKLGCTLAPRLICRLLIWATGSREKDVAMPKLISNRVHDYDFINTLITASKFSIEFTVLL